MRAVAIIPATPAHAADLAPRIADSILCELGRIAPLSREEIAHQSVATSAHAWSLILNGRVACIFGVCVASITDGRAFPWLIASPDIAQHPRFFLEGSRKFINLLREQYSVLEGYADVDHVKSIKWLRRLGFTIHAPQPFGPSGFPFHHFEMRS